MKNETSTTSFIFTMLSILTLQGNEIFWLRATSTPNLERKKSKFIKWKRSIFHHGCILWPHRSSKFPSGNLMFIFSILSARDNKECTWYISLFNYDSLEVFVVFIKLLEGILFVVSFQNKLTRKSQQWMLLTKDLNSPWEGGYMTEGAYSMRKKPVSFSYFKNLA